MVQLGQLGKAVHGGGLHGRNPAGLQSVEALAKLVENRRGQAYVVRGDGGGEKKVAVKDLFMVAFGVQDVRGQFAGLGMPLLHHTQLAGAKKDRLSPAGV